MAGCDHQYMPLLGGWIPVRNANMATSVDGVYAAGDCAGVAGSVVALDEGRIAGLAAAHALGCLSAADTEARMVPCRRRLGGIHHLRAALDAISVTRAGLYELATDDTVVCRCEEITLGEIRAALAHGVDDMNAIKRMTRMGMGSCQGRYCGPGLHEIIARERRVAPADLIPLNPRPPVRPVPLAALAGNGGLE